MNLSYIKLDAKKSLVKNNFKCFAASSLPYIAGAALTALNYYFYLLLLKISLPYGVYLKASALTVCALLSFVFRSIIRLFADRYIFMKSRKKYIKRPTLRRCLTYCTVSVLKFFLSTAWGALYLFPCAAVTGALFYCIRTGQYGRNVTAALAASSAVLLLIGLFFLYVTLKRYSMTDGVLLAWEEHDALKIIAKSAEIMDGNTARYSVYCLSFIGWLLSCVLIFPIIYVLPYTRMAKYTFFDSVTEKAPPEKPIIFYLNKKQA